MKHRNTPWPIVASLAPAVVIIACLAVGCANVAKIATQVVADQGTISEEQAGSITRTIEAGERAFAELTPEQEHYIGRAVAASLLAQYPPLDDPQANRYLNRLGQALALASDRPETFGGYRFLLLDTDEINAFACPGGLVLVTRGLIGCCENEDALAAVLAHEIAHVAAKHGLRSIKSSRLTSALTILGTEGVRMFGSEDIARLAEDLEGSITDITQTLARNGYSRDLEREADRAAVAILERIGYNPRGLEAMLNVMQQKWRARGPGFMRTHPSPRDRISDIAPLIEPAESLRPHAARQSRFQTALAGV
jgi:beta-barrel assembly-enhancing protease